VCLFEKGIRTYDNVGIKDKCPKTLTSPVVCDSEYCGIRGWFWSASRE